MRTWILWIALLVGPGCSSLERSGFDRELRVHGVYLCPVQPVPRPAGESVDTAVPRCFQDSLAVSAGRVAWSRRYFVDRECQGRVIGAADWVTALELDVSPGGQTPARLGPVTSRNLVRADYNWFLDQPAGCDLRHLPVNEAVAIKESGNCGALFPIPGERVAVFKSAGRAGADQLELQASATARVCRR